MEDLTNNSTETEVTNATESTPDVKALMEQIAELKASGEKQKLALDKALKEKGEITKALREKQSTEERELAERMAEDERKQAEYESAIAELNHLKATNSYTGVLEEKAIESLIKAVSEGNHTDIAKIIANAKEQAINNYRVESNSKDSQINFGNSTNVVTKESIMKIKDSAERQKAISENIELFR